MRTTEQADFGRGWAYRASTAAGQHLSTIRLSSDSEALEWGFAESQAHPHDQIALARHVTASDTWTLLGKFGPVISAD